VADYLSKRKGKGSIMSVVQKITAKKSAGGVTAPPDRLLLDIIYRCPIRPLTKRQCRKTS